MELLTLENLKKEGYFDVFLEKADKNFKSLGYKEHGFRHAEYTQRVTAQILSGLSFSKEDIEIGKIAGYLHDIGNAFSRKGHEETGAIFVLKRFIKKKFVDEGIRIAKIIGEHENRSNIPPDSVLAAVIFGDKSDVHRQRVRKRNFQEFDEHDRVNYACTDSSIAVARESKEIVLSLKIDTSISAPFDYFQIFLSRFKFLKKASEVLELRFVFYINNVRIL